MVSQTWESLRQGLRSKEGGGSSSIYSRYQENPQRAWEKKSGDWKIVKGLEVLALHAADPSSSPGITCGLQSEMISEDNVRSKT